MWYTDITPDQATASMIPFPWTVDDLNENGIVSATSTGHNSIVSSAVALRGYDLDSDGLVDFDFQATHDFPEDQQHPNSWIFMGSKKDHVISLSDKAKHYIKKYSFGDALDYESFGTNSDDLLSEYLIKKDELDSFESDGEFYIAVKKTIKNKSHYGWFRVQLESASSTVIVKEFALCRNADEEITIGQKD